MEDRSPLPDPGLLPAATPVRPDRRSVLGATDAAGAPAPPSGEPVVGGESPVVPFVEDPGPVLEVRPDGLVVVPGTILRVRDHVGSIAAEPERVAVGVRQGWCWVSPGDGEPVPVRVDLPAASVTAPAGSTVLAVVERDGSSFVVVADGHARLDHPGGIDALTAGDVVMIDAVGAVQTDRATHEEIESDPLVAENLALDAEL